MLKKVISIKNVLILLSVIVISIICYIVGVKPEQVRLFIQKVINKIKSFLGMDIHTTKRNYTESDGKLAIAAVREKYGVDMAKIVEKMFRLETNHFKSGQYKQTGTPGMEAGKWPANEVPSTLPTMRMKDNHLNDGLHTFIIWNPTDCALFLARYIKRYNGNFARWNSTNEVAQSNYRNKIGTIKAKFV